MNWRLIFFTPTYKSFAPRPANANRYEPELRAQALTWVDETDALTS